MSFDHTWSKTTLASILTVGLGTHASIVMADEPKLEKCYGIVKKGMNECGTAIHPCEGQSPKDNDPTEWIYVLEGTCKKIVNGSVKPPVSEQTGDKGDKAANTTADKADKTGKADKTDKSEKTDAPKDKK